jgi:hypothetical protein
MNEHLSSKQIAEWIAGNRTAIGEQHITGCMQCRRELDSFSASLSLFSNSVRAWSEHEQSLAQSAQVRAAAPLQARFAHPLRWATIAASLLLLLLSGMTYREHVAEQHRIEQRQLERARADAALLEQVDTEVSQSVPSTFEPLAQLMYTDTAGQNTGKQTKAINDSGDTQ